MARLRPLVLFVLLALSCTKRAPKETSEPAPATGDEPMPGNQDKQMVLGRTKPKSNVVGAPSTPGATPSAPASATASTSAPRD